jgi:hypothetical protein
MCFADKAAQSQTDQPQSSCYTDKHRGKCFHRVLSLHGRPPGLTCLLSLISGGQHGAQALHCSPSKSEMWAKRFCDLYHLRRKQGKSQVARRVLTDVYSWFTEGFDTADLLMAKARLENRMDYL